MSSVALPVGLPAGTDTGSALSKEIRPNQTTPVPGFLSWTIPGGEVWLATGLVALLGTSAAVGSRRPTLYFQDQDGNDIYSASCAGGIPANTPAEVSAGLGAPINEAITAAGDGDYRLPLPWLPLNAGYTVMLVNGTGSDVGDRWEGTCILTVTYWDLGSSTGGGGGAAPLGPYLYVPGPETVAT